MNIFHKIALKTLYKNKVRTAVTIVGVILSTAMITAVTTMIASIQNYMLDTVIKEEGYWQALSSPISPEKAEQIEALDEVEEAARIQSVGYAKNELEDGAFSFHYFAGIEEQDAKMLSLSLLAGRMPAAEIEIIIPWQYTDNGDASFKIGDNITVELGKRMFQGSELSQFDSIMDEEEFIPEQKRTFTVVGVYEGFNVFSYRSNTILMFPNEALNNKVYLSLTIENPKDIYDFVDQNFADTDATIAFHTGLLRYLGIADNDNFYTVLMGLGAVAVCLIIGGSISLIYNAFSISVSERTKQFGLLSSVGATKRQMRKMISFEAFVISAIGIPLGIIGGILGIGVTLHFISGGFSRFVGNTGDNIDVVVSLPAVLLAAGLAFLTVMISSYLPAKRSSNVSAIEAIRQNNDIKLPARKLKTPVSVYRMFKLEGLLASKNYKRNRRKYRSTVISLVLSMVLFISASSFIIYLKGSTSLVFEGPEADIYYSDEMSKTEEEMDSIYTMLLQTPGIKASAYFRLPAHYQVNVEKELLMNYITNGENARFGETESGGNVVPVVFFIMKDGDFEEYMKAQGINAKPYLDADQFMGVLYDNSKYFDSITEKYMRRPILNLDSKKELLLSNYSYNSETEIYVEDAESKINQEKLTIKLPDQIQKRPMGADYSGDYGTVSVFLPDIQYDKYLRELQSSEPLSGIMAFQADGYDKVYELMEESLNSIERFNKGRSSLYNASATEAEDRNTVIAIEVLSAGFIILISLIAIANVFNTVSTSIQLRRREFAMLRSVGMTQKGFHRMMYYECLLCGSRAILFGLPLSAVVLLFIFRSVRSGVDVQFMIPWGGIAIAVISVFLVVLLTMLYAINKLRKENTLDALKNENQ